LNLIPLPRIHPEVAAPELARELPPAQINLFTGEPEAVVIPIETEPPDGEERIIDEGIRMVKTGDTSQVVLSGFGMFLSKKSERLLVRQGKTVVYEFPLFRLSVKEIIGQRAAFMGREHRGATDAVNALLNYGYGILYAQV
jgi:hypothetical protein